LDSINGDGIVSINRLNGSGTHWPRIESLELSLVLRINVIDSSLAQDFVVVSDRNKVIIDSLLSSSHSSVDPGKVEWVGCADESTLSNGKDLKILVRDNNREGLDNGRLNNLDGRLNNLHGRGLDALNGWALDGGCTRWCGISDHICCGGSAHGVHICGISDR
jgi:hypothetical protein